MPKPPKNKVRNSPQPAARKSAKPARKSAKSKPAPPSRAAEPRKPASSARKTAKSPAPFDEDFVRRLARKTIQSLKPYVPGKSIEDVRALYNPPVITKLGSNENPLGASPKVVEALQAVIGKVSLYPDGASRDLRKALAGAHGLLPEQVMVGNGSDEVLLNIAAAFLNPGETVLCSENTFSEYEFSGRIFDGRIDKVPLKENRYDLAGFRKRLKRRPKLIFLCNPNNPTGNHFTHQELADLLAAVPRKTLVVVDEAYCEYATAPGFPRSLELLASHPNLVVSRTFSKIFGMAGLRLGYGFAHPLVVRECQRVKTPFNVSLPAQAAALAALADGDFVARSIGNNNLGRVFLEDALNRLGLQFLPTQANFICFRTKRLAVDVHEDLLKQGVIARPLRSFGMDYWTRVTIGTPEQNERFVAALESVI